MEPNVDIEAVLADPEATGELIKRLLSGQRTFLEEVLISFLRGYFNARAKLERQQ